MITNVVQGWRKRRAVYRPPGELIRFDPRAFEVASIPGDRVAKEFVETHHYSGSYPAARERFGLYEHGKLVGVAVFSNGGGPKVLRVLPCNYKAAVELGRFVLLDGTGMNAETWFFARCRELLARKGYAGIVSFSDPVPRTNLAGDVVFPGHIGGVYKASNAIYTGLATRRLLRLLPDGLVFSPRAKSKIQAKAKGWVYAVDQLVAAGAPGPADTSVAGLRAWLDRAVPLVTRPLRHGGNHRYLWTLDRAAGRALDDHLKKMRVPVLPYPRVQPVRR